MCFSPPVSSRPCNDSPAGSWSPPAWRRSRGLTVLDYYAPPEVSFLIFYVAPVLFLVWFVGPVGGVSRGGLAAAFWFYEDVLSPNAMDIPHRWRTGTSRCAVFLVAFVWVLAELKARARAGARRGAGAARARRRIARRCRRVSFPRADPEIPGLESTGSAGRRGAWPATTSTSWRSRGPLGIAVGDVAGKGHPAALLMASLQGALRTMRPGPPAGPATPRGPERPDPRPDRGDRFATFFWAAYDEKRGTLEYVNAGHNPPMLLRARARSSDCGSRRTAARVFASPGATYRQGPSALSPGDLLVIFTDGVTEAVDPRSGSSATRASSASLRETAGPAAAAVCEAVLAAGPPASRRD